MRGYICICVGVFSDLGTDGMLQSVFDNKESISTDSQLCIAKADFSQTHSEISKKNQEELNELRNQARNTSSDLSLCITYYSMLGLK